MSTTHGAMGKDHKIPFDQLDGKGVKVAVVDSGIDALAPQSAGFVRGVDLSLSPGGGVRVGVAVTDRAGHGTACAGIIRRIAPAVELYSVRILDESMRADGRLLVAAIDWAIEEGMDVVNLSLGTEDAALRRGLLDICQCAMQADVIVVAAMANRSTASYPACLEPVISVGSQDLPGKFDYIYQHGDVPECLANGGRQRLRWAGGKEVWMGGNSFAAPRVTAVVALIRERFGGLSLQGVRAMLDHNSKVSASASLNEGPGNTSEPWGRNYEWINRAILYPFTKEMHAFVRFSDLLEFEVVGIVDLPLRGNVGKDAGEALRVKPSGIRVVSHIDRVMTKADTLILGYTGELGRLRGDDIIARWLSTALERQLNVFSFQTLSAPRYQPHLRAAREQDLTFMAPEVPAEGELLLPVQTEPVDVPVLAVFGTSSSQGKLTLQLALRRILAERGYCIGQIGTEPHAELLGMDYAFPIGHASTVNLPLDSYPEYLDGKMRELCKRKRPDLIIGGSQSGTIPFDLHDPQTFALPSLSFMLGIKPDACVLVVNAIDAESYIRDTIEAIGAIGKCPVLALALSDQSRIAGASPAVGHRISDTDLSRTLQRLEDHFSIAVVSIASESGIRRLTERIVD